MVLIDHYFLFLDHLNTDNYSTIKDLENAISFIKPKRMLVNHELDSNIKFGPPNATSTIKPLQTLQCVSM